MLRLFAPARARGGAGRAVPERSPDAFRALTVRGVDPVDLDVEWSARCSRRSRQPDRSRLVGTVLEVLDGDPDRGERRGESADRRETLGGAECKSNSGHAGQAEREPARQTGQRGEAEEQRSDRHGHDAPTQEPPDPDVHVGREHQADDHDERDPHRGKRWEVVGAEELRQQVGPDTGRHSRAGDPECRSEDQGDDQVADQTAGEAGDHDADDGDAERGDPAGAVTEPGERAHPPREVPERIDDAMVEVGPGRCHPPEQTERERGEEEPADVAGASTARCDPIGHEERDRPDAVSPGRETEQRRSSRKRSL